MINNLFTTIFEINTNYEEDAKGFGSLPWLQVQVYEEDGELKFTPNQ